MTPAISLADDSVWPMLENPPCVPLPEGSRAARRSDQFDVTLTARY